MPIKRSLNEREKIKNFLLSTNIDYLRNKEICNKIYEKFNINITPKQITAYKHLLGLKSKLKIGYVKRICQNCGQEFYVLNHKLKYEKHYYCSYSCSGKAKSKKSLRENLKNVSEFEIKNFIQEWNDFIKKEIRYNKSFLDADYLYGVILYYIPSILNNTKKQNITGNWLKSYIRKAIKYKIWRELVFYKKNIFFNEYEKKKIGI